MAMTRKGYFHALEGVLAALIVAVYLTSVVNVPDTYDWSGVHVSNEAEDIVSALDRSGMLDRFILQDDSKSLNAVVNALDSSLSYQMQVSGISPPELNIAMLVNDSQTFTVSSTVGAWSDAALGIIDDFDDGDLSEYNGDTTAFGFSSTSWDGANALLFNGGSNALITSSSGLDNYPVIGEAFQYRYQPNGSSGEHAARFAVSGSDGYEIVHNLTDDRLELWRLGGTDTLLDSASASFDQGKWYHTLVDWKASSAVASFSTESDWASGTTNRTTPDSGRARLGYEDTAPALRGYWRMDTLGSAPDHSGNGNDGTLTNMGPGQDEFSDGVFSTESYFFRDTSDHIDIPSDPSLEDYGQITISAWLKPMGPAPSNWAHIISKSAESVGTGDADYGILQRNTGELVFRLNTGGSYSDEHAVGNTPTNGSWQHVVGTWDGSTMYLYQNGVQTGSNSITGTLNDADGPLGIGRHADNTDQRWFDGFVDEVRIYEAYKTPQEVQELYLDGPSFSGSHTITVDTGSTGGWQLVNVNASVPGTTSADMTFYAIDSSGSVVGTDTVNLNDGTENYTVSVPDSEDAEIFFAGTSNDPADSWMINEATVHRSGDDTIIVTVEDRSGTQLAQVTSDDDTYSSGGIGWRGNGSEGLFDAAYLGTGNGLPDSEHPYRRGNLSDISGFGSVPFILSDTSFDGVLGYDAASFDLNGDGDFVDASDVTVYQGDRFLCDTGVSRCDGAYYGIGPINTTLTMFDARSAQRWADLLNYTIDGDRRTEMRVFARNPKNSSLSIMDAAISIGNSQSFLAAHRGPIDTLLSRDGTVIVADDGIGPGIAAGSFVSSLGFENKTTGVTGSGPMTVRLGEDSNSDGGIVQTYRRTGITPTDMSPSGTYYQGTLEVRSNSIGVRQYRDSREVAFSTDGYTTRYEPGQTVSLGGNDYRIDTVIPVRLLPVGTTLLTGFDTQNISGDEYPTVLENYRLDTDGFTQFAAATGEITDLGNVPEGVINTSCDLTRQPYRTGSVTINGDDHPFITVNTHTTVPCDPYYDLVYVDWNRDGDYLDSASETPDILPDEGPFTHESHITLDNMTHRMDIVDGTAGLSIVLPQDVGTVPVLNGIDSGKGTAAVIGRTTLGHDDAGLLRAILLSSSHSPHRFNEPSDTDSDAYGYIHSGRTATGQTYTVETSWWAE